MFVVFRQTNSGGKYIIDDTRKIGHYMVIEAKTRTIAYKVMELLGMFDLPYCSCCGPRFGYGEDYETLGEALSDNQTTHRGKKATVYLILSEGCTVPILI